MSHPGAERPVSYDLRLVPLPVAVARLMLAGMLHAERLGVASVEQQPPWHRSIRCPTASMPSRCCSLAIGRCWARSTSRPPGGSIR